jgi:hypothetical protein
MAAIPWDGVNRSVERMRTREECERTGAVLPDWAKRDGFFHCIRCDRPFRSQVALDHHYLSHPPANEECAFWRHVDRVNSARADERHARNARAEVLERGFHSMREVVECAREGDGEAQDLIDDLRDDGVKISRLCQSEGDEGGSVMESDDDCDSDGEDDE